MEGDAEGVSKGERGREKERVNERKKDIEREREKQIEINSNFIMTRHIECNWEREKEVKYRKYVREREGESLNLPVEIHNYACLKG